MTKKLLDVPDSLNEEYYQINLDIRNSFSKYRPPLNIYRFHEAIGRLEPYYRVGERLSNEQVEGLERLVQEGFAFVSRSDHPIYVKHISHQLDLVLIDKNLKPSEICDILMQALTMRMEHFQEQPVKAVYERLREDIFVLTEYLAADIYRIKGLVKRLHKKHTLANHSVNSGIVGLGLFLCMQSEDFTKADIPRKNLDNMALALFLHDVGMAKIPAFIRDKANNLTPEEQSKLLQHPKLGYEVLTKIDAKFSEAEKAVLEHHERMNGSGYPNKLKENEISYVGRLTGIVDSYCAMITDKPYGEGMDPETAVRELARDEKRYDAKITKFFQSEVLTKKLPIAVREIG
ncbi:HD-GYP domain-containing protein [Desulfocurvibacter africanus]|uniref:Metal dependent phosphohydrolase n=1 Tax=Desulfocurvibacter africanus subsp. africanus str. Walvis Bay TaxID=690850 RepID=F3YWY0_DESAF|nr:HD domain-containing phosphohydrolase [Desulfocurvibacter africanus]EGJ51704.1 metal dependent phosphohydrolase [Desulfocurvibacter africanus subsp. africanus str. Walvis Bay]